jgi:hypothetical protein
LLQRDPSLGHHLYGLPRREVDSKLFVATALWAVDELIEVPFFRRLDEHFFVLQTIFGVLHVRCGNVCLKTTLYPAIPCTVEKRWIIRALGLVVDLASFFI